MPQALGALLLGGISGIGGFGSLAGSTIFGISIGSIFGTALITGALIGLQFLLPRPGLPEQPDGRQAVKQAIPPRRRGYGRVRLGGVYMCYEVAGGVSYDVLAIADGPVNFVKYFLHDDEVEVAPITGLVQAGEAGRYGGGNVQIRTNVGLPTETAYADVYLALPAIWTPDHRGDGIASMMLRCSGVKVDDYQKIYPNGLPEPSVVVDVGPVWDPRDNAQSADDPTTWTYSSNPVLQLLDYLTSNDHGLGLEREFYIDPQLDNWIEEANLCDELVAKVGGTEKRYESNGWYTYDTKPADVIGAILSTCNGWLDQDGEGAFVIKVGVYREPTVTLTEKNRLSLNPNYGISDEELTNELTLSFTDPNQKYKQTPLQSRRNELSISESGLHTKALSFDWVQSFSQVYRLAKQTMGSLNPAISGTVVVRGAAAFQALGRRWVRFQFSPVFAGLQDTVVEITKGRIDLVNDRVTLEWRTFDPATMNWNPATEEGPGPAEVIQLVPESLPVPVIESVVAVGDLPFHIDVTWGAPDRNDLTWAVRVRLVDVGGGNPGNWSTVTFNNLEAVDGNITATLFPTTEDEYEVEVAAIGPRGSFGDWSEPATAALTSAAMNFSLARNSGYLALLEDI